MEGVNGELLPLLPIILLKMEFSELPLIFLNGVELCVEYTGDGIDCGDKVDVTDAVLIDNFDSEDGFEFDDDCRQNNFTLLMN